MAKPRAGIQRAKETFSVEQADREVPKAESRVKRVRVNLGEPQKIPGTPPK